MMKQCDRRMQFCQDPLVFAPTDCVDRWSRKLQIGRWIGAFVELWVGKIAPNEMTILGRERKHRKIDAIAQSFGKSSSDFAKGKMGERHHPCTFQRQLCFAATLQEFRQGQRVVAWGCLLKNLT